MKLKHILAFFLPVIAAAGVLAGCGAAAKPASSAASSAQEITVGINPGYSEELFDNVIIPDAKAQGLIVHTKVFSDYVTPNKALAAGDIDLNSFQHVPFLTTFNQTNGTDLVPIGNTYLAPLRLYSKKVKNIKDLKDGASIGIPNDPNNGGRSLLILARLGLIQVKDGIPATKLTVQDITANPHNLQFIELEAPQLPRSLEDTDASFVNAGYAQDAKLPKDEVIGVEDNTSPFVNVIAARKADKDNPTYQKFVKIFQSEHVKKYINEHFDGGLVPAF